MARKDATRPRDSDDVDAGGARPAVEIASPPSPAIEAVNLRDLGAALRERRNQRGTSLAEVAAATGLSPSFISLVESGRSDISFGRLIRLANYYGVGLSELLPETRGADAEVVRHEERRSVSSPVEGIEMYLLAPDVHRTVMPLLVRYEPGGETAEFTDHAGEEFIYVLEGTIVLMLAGRDPITLSAGDSAYFKSTTPHALTNPGDVPTRLIAMITPPTW
jgi:transcriptional regulator with XRE-family HTH domain